MDPVAMVNQLLRQRIVCLDGPIDDDVANATIAKLLFLEQEDRHADVTLRIASPGGHVAAAFAIADTIEQLACRVATRATGSAHGVAALVLARGARGHRSVVRGARIAFVPVGGPLASRADVKHAERAVFEHLAASTGQTVEQIAADHRSGRSFDAGEAVAYGLVDEIA